MKVKSVFYMATLLFAAALTGCSSDDFVDGNVDLGGTLQGPIRFTTTIGSKDESTRALKDAWDEEIGDYIYAYWSDGSKGVPADEVAIIADNKKVGTATVTRLLSNGAAIVSGTIDGVQLGENVKLLYPAAAAEVLTENGEIPASYYSKGPRLHRYTEGQDGTLEDIANKYAVAFSEEGPLTMATYDGEQVASLPKRVSFTNENAICKFRFKINPDDANEPYLMIRKFIITDEEGEIYNYVGFDEPQEAVYIAMQPKEGSPRFKYRIAVDGEDDFYCGTATANLEAGVFYDLNYLKLGRYMHDDWIDMGDAIGKWGPMNVGAFWQGEPGGHFAWGETEANKSEVYNWENYKWCSDPRLDYLTMSKYNRSDRNYEIDFEDDAARVNWGKYGTPWRIPTVAEWNAIATDDGTNVTLKWLDKDDPENPYGVNGKLITSVSTGKSMFLAVYGTNLGTPGLTAPESTGYYWTREMSIKYEYDKKSASDAIDFECYDGGYRMNDFYRYGGFTIRAVLDDTDGDLIGN